MGCCLAKGDVVKDKDAMHIVHEPLLKDQKGGNAPGFQVPVVYAERTLTREQSSSTIKTAGDQSHQYGGGYGSTVQPGERIVPPGAVDPAGNHHGASVQNDEPLNLRHYHQGPSRISKTDSLASNTSTTSNGRVHTTLPPPPDHRASSPKGPRPPLPKPAGATAPQSASHGPVPPSVPPPIRPSAPRKANGHHGSPKPPSLPRNANAMASPAAPVHAPSTTKRLSGPRPPQIPKPVAAH